MKNPAGRAPPAAIAIEVHVPAAVSSLPAQHIGRCGQQRLTVPLKDLHQQSRCEGELIAFAGQGSGFQLPKVQKRREVISAVKRAHLLDQAALSAVGRLFLIADLAVEHVDTLLPIRIGGIVVHEVGGLEPTC